MLLSSLPSELVDPQQSKGVDDRDVNRAVAGNDHSHVVMQRDQCAVGKFVIAVIISLTGGNREKENSISVFSIASC